MLLTTFLLAVSLLPQEPAPAVPPVGKRAATLRELPAALYLAAAFADAQHGLVVGGHGEKDPGIAERSSDGGASWVACPLPAGVTRLYGVCLVDAQLGYACGLHGNVVRTRDGGASWERVSTPFAKAWFAAIAFVDAQHGCVVGSLDGPLLARTQDGGATWERVQVGGPGREGGLRHLRFVDATLGFACGEQGLLLRTADAGASWAAVPSGSQAWLRHLWFVDRTHGFVAAGDGKVLATEDGGLTWRARGSVPDKANAVAFRDRLHGALVSMDGGLWRTDDGGATFTRALQAKGHLTVVLPRADGWLAFGDGGLVRAPAK